jgi:hypothetical protein
VSWFAENVVDATLSGHLFVPPSWIEDIYPPQPYGGFIAPQYASSAEWYYANVVDARRLGLTPERAAFLNYWELYGKQAGAWTMKNVADAGGFGAPITRGPGGAPVGMTPHDWWDWAAKNVVDWTGLAGAELTNPFWGGGWTNEFTGAEWSAKYGPEAAYPVSYRPHGGGGGGRRWKWKPWTHEEQVAKLEGYNVEYNYLRYPWMESWAAELGHELAVSPQGRYGKWWGGYWEEGMSYEEWQRKQWEFEKGRYALGADAPSIEDMSSAVDAMMISDEVLWLAENSDLSSVIGAEFYRIGRETG